jgi:hypothetical protein
MKGFKPMGRGMSHGFKYPTNMGFSGSTGTVTSVAGYTRKKFATGGFVRQDNPREKVTSGIDPGRATVSRARPSNNLDQEAGGRSPLRPGYERGGVMRKGAGQISEKEGQRMRDAARRAARSEAGVEDTNPFSRLRGAGQISEKEAALLRKRDGGKIGVTRGALSSLRSALRNRGVDPRNTHATLAPKSTAAGRKAAVTGSVKRAMKSAASNPGVNPKDSHPTQSAKWQANAQRRGNPGYRKGGGVKKNC